MKQFSQLNFHEEEPKKEYLFKGNHKKVIKLDHDWEVTEGGVGVVCIPHIIETNEIILREELVPSYQYVDKQERHLVLVGGGVEKGEKVEEALFRELEEEAGIKINPGWVNYEKWNELYSGKNSTGKCHFYYIPLKSGDYNVVTAKGDGSFVEDNSTAVRVSVDWLDSLKPADVTTALALEYFKTKVV